MAGEQTPAARFGGRVAAKRAERGWSMRQLCARAGLPAEPSAIRRIERGGGNGAGLNVAVPIARALGISLDGLDGPCARCGDKPPAGFMCPVCGTEGEVTG
jgi:transcriptional regulator with XRE-family HTH domain